MCVCLWRNVLWRSGDFDDRRRSFITQPQFLFDMEKIKESSAGWCVPVIFVCSCLLYIHMQVNTNQYSCWLILVCHFILILFFLARLSAAVYGFFGCCYRLQCLTFAAKICFFYLVLQRSVRPVSNGTQSKTISFTRKLIYSNTEIVFWESFMLSFGTNENKRLIESDSQLHRCVWRLQLFYYCTCDV